MRSIFNCAIVLALCWLVSSCAKTSIQDDLFPTTNPDFKPNAILLGPEYQTITHVFVYGEVASEENPNQFIIWIEFPDGSRMGVYFKEMVKSQKMAYEIDKNSMKKLQEILDVIHGDAG